MCGGTQWYIQAYIEKQLENLVVQVKQSCALYM